MSSHSPDAPDNASWTKSAVLLYNQGLQNKPLSGLPPPRSRRRPRPDGVSDRAYWSTTAMGSVSQ